MLDAQESTDRFVQGMLATGRWLAAQGYRFVTPTPATHARVNGRANNRQAQDLRGIFGWSRPFTRSVLDRDVLRNLQDAELLQSEAGLLRSRVRYSSLNDQLYVHSAYPTTQPDAVFFGPDTYRFAQMIESELVRAPLRSGARILDGLRCRARRHCGHPGLACGQPHAGAE
jgi:hypothetical protein